MLSCSKCAAALTPNTVQDGAWITCSACNSPIRLSLFPALVAGRATLSESELALSEGQSSCFHHAGKRAVHLCAECGKFLCALCSIDLNGQIWCPTCLSTASAKRSLSQLETKRTLWDSIALGTAIWPFFIFFYVCVFTAPAAIFISLRHWKSPSSLVPRSKIRFIAAIAVATLQVVLIVAVVVVLARTFSVRRS